MSLVTATPAHSPVIPAAQTLVDLLLQRAVDSGNRTAYTFLEDGEDIGETVTYAGFARRTLALASVLQRRFAPGERLLLLYPPCIEYMAAFFACLCANLIAVPLFPPRGSKRNLRLEAIARDCDPCAALTSGKRVNQIHAAVLASPQLAGLELISTDTPGMGDAALWRHPDTRPETIAFLQYTSGSTGLPKGVMVDHSNVLHNEYMIAASFESHQHSNIVTWLPIYHDMGLIGNMLQSFWLGSECVFMASVAFLQRPIRWLRAVSHFRARISGGPNFAYDLCVDKIAAAQREGLDLSHWKVAFNGAEPVRRASLERFAAAFAGQGFAQSALHPCYGMAEATLIVSGGAVERPPLYLCADKAQLSNGRIVVQNDERAQALVSCGATAPGQTIRIVDPVTHTPCPQRSVGEVWLCGPNITQGYWNRPEVNAAVFNARITGSAEGPFLRTGDLGFLDAAELYITGRMKDLIIVRGANYYPQDIEATVEAADPRINPAGVAAFGVADESGEKIIVVAEVTRTALRRLDARALTASIRQQVLEEREVSIDAVMLIRPGALPKSSSGKVQRGQCRALYLSEELDLAVERPGAAEEAMAMAAVG